MQFEDPTALEKLVHFVVCDLAQDIECGNHDPVLLIFDGFYLVVLQALFQAIPKLLYRVPLRSSSRQKEDKGSVLLPHPVLENSIIFSTVI